MSKITVKLRENRISIQADGGWLAARLCHSPQVRALVLVLCPGTMVDPLPAPGLADALHDEGFATLTVNLLTAIEEQRDPDAAYHVPLLANRVLAVVEWARHQPEILALPLLSVASGTACGAIVRAASKAPERFAAIVCLAGRPDLAGAGPLAALETPTRFIVADSDPDLAIVTRAFEELAGEHDLQTCSGADMAATTIARALEWLGRWSGASATSRGDAPPEEPSD